MLLGFLWPVFLSLWVIEAHYSAWLPGCLSDAAALWTTSVILSSSSFQLQPSVELCTCSLRWPLFPSCLLNLCFLCSCLDQIQSSHYHSVCRQWHGSPHTLPSLAKKEQATVGGWGCCVALFPSISTSATGFPQGLLGVGMPHDPSEPSKSESTRKTSDREGSCVSAFWVIRHPSV